jgi:type IV pilus assembly protein PilY1
MRTDRVSFAISCTALYGLLFCFAASAATPVDVTDLATKPLKASVLVKPNVILGIDDSGSMDGEVMLYTNDGAFWWNYIQQKGWGTQTGHPNAACNATGATCLLFNSAGGADGTWRKMVYLFPNGLGKDDGRRLYTDAAWDHFAILPTTQFAFLRSSAYNGMYYNPQVDYAPWAPAYTTAAVTPAPAVKTKAWGHPLETGGTDSWFDLTANVTVAAAPAVNTTFTAFPGMALPYSATAGNVKKRECTHTLTAGIPTGCGAWGAWTNVTAATNAAAGKVTQVAVTYYPATYWVVDTACTVTTTNVLTDSCTYAPDGTTKLKRIEIKSTVTTYPSGRTYEAEAQNFANWFQYYRKRRLTLSAAVGEVMESLTGMRVGLVYFNGHAVPTMYDTDATLSSQNGQRVSGSIYQNASFGGGGTPTRETLKYIGDRYQSYTNDSNNQNDIIQYACQRNNVFIMTDGFANVPSPNPVVVPTYDASTWGTGAPYATIHAASLADQALAYYTVNPRTDLSTAGVVPTTPTDLNTQLHMNTYALTMGALGTIYKDEATPLPTDPGAWPAPTQNRSPTAVDDLWHATINGRGKMYIARDPTTTALSIQSGFNDMIQQVGAQSAVSVSSVNLVNGDGKAYTGKYNPAGWAGDVAANELDPVTGEIGSEVWSAAAELTDADWGGRLIVSHNGGGAVNFSEAGVGDVVNPGGVWGSPADVINYLRGDRSKEGSSFRTRTSLLGAVINARPVVSGADEVVYAQSGEGMLHAFDSTTGSELWAYVPHSVLGSIGASTSRSWTFETLLDGSPRLSSVGDYKYLVAGRGAAGGGYYALEVSDPKSLNTVAELTARVKWDISHGDTSNGGSFTLGASMGRPIVVPTRDHGTVALLTQGYNGSDDGVGRLYLVDVESGERQLTLSVTSAGAGTDAGLTHISALGGDDGLVRYVYGGDLHGNLWRFDLEGAGAVVKLATLLAADGATKQPITSAPELMRVDGQVVVLVGTGRLLGLDDMGQSDTQSFYAIKDTGTELTAVRSHLAERTLTDPEDDMQDIEGDAFSWETSNGWYVDLPAGQLVNTDPAVAFGAVVFVANKADMDDCSASSYLYVMDVATGLKAGEMTWASKELSDVYNSSGVTLGGTGGGGGGDVFFWDQLGSGVAGGGTLPIVKPIPARKNAWRQIHR